MKFFSGIFILSVLFFASNAEEVTDASNAEEVTEEVRHLRRHFHTTLSRNYRPDRVVPLPPNFFSCHPETPTRCRTFIRQCNQPGFDRWRNGLGQRTNICGWIPATCHPWTEGCVNYHTHGAGDTHQAG